MRGGGIYDCSHVPTVWPGCLFVEHLSSDYECRDQRRHLHWSVTDFLYIIAFWNSNQRILEER